MPHGRHQVQDVHTHDAFEIDYVARGNARLVCGGSSRVLPAGSLCMVSPRFLHESVAGDDCIDLRMADAKRLLRNPDLTVEKVAEACGYQSLVHFSRSFRNRFGISPSAWRRSENLE